MNPWLQDLRYALRTFTKSPGFSAVAVLTLALGIGANAAIFALVDRVLLRLLAVRSPEELVLLRSPGPSQGHDWSDGDDDASFSYPMYRSLRDTNPVFSGLIAEFPFDANVSSGNQTERASGELVSGNYFGVLGVSSSLGRIFSLEDDRVPGGHPIAVLSHGYWTRRFGNDPSILDRTIVVNGQVLTVVGVARAGFLGIQPGRPADLFVPTMMKAQMTPFWNGLDDPKDYWIQLVGRLKPGLSRSEAESRLAPVYQGFNREILPLMTHWSERTQKEFLNRRILLVPGGHGRRVLASNVGTPLLSLMGMVALVLLIACSNLAGLLAARGAARQREYGIRLAIGASRFQLLRQSLFECLVYAAVGGGLGLLAAEWTLQALLGAFPPDDGLRQVGVTIDPRVLLFAGVVSLVAAVLFGAAPSWRAARLDPAKTIRGQGRGTASAGSEVIRFRQWLVTGQVALTLILLVAAGLFVRSLRNLGRVDLGFRPERVIGFSVAPKLNGYPSERTATLGRQLMERLAGLPGVRSVAAAQLPTIGGSVTSGNFSVEGRPEVPGENANARRNLVSPRYFSTMGIPLLLGREFEWSDGPTSPGVAVVNETLVRRFLQGRSPIGARISYGPDSAARHLQIVGVVRNSKNADVDEDDRPFIYVPWMQDPNLGELTFYLRTEADPRVLAAPIRGEVRALDPQLPVYDLMPLTTRIDESLATQRLLVLLSAAFGGLAALLAALGIYGVLSFAVAARRAEIGVRMALGADPAAVRRLVLRDVARFLIVGTAIGLPCAYLLARGVESILFGVHASDPSVFAFGAGLMAIVALAAGWPPAVRAARTDAIDALRSE